MATAKRFCAALFGLYAALLAGAAALVYAVDPFDLLGRNWTGVHAASERQAKPAMLRGGRYDAILLGTSKTTYVDAGRLCLPRVFNASFPAAAPEEMVEFLRRFMGDGHRTVLVGLDLFMFNESMMPLRADDSFPDNDAGRVLGYLLGWRPVERAAQALLRHWRGAEPFLRADGSRTAGAQLARHAAMAEPDHGAVLDHLMAHHYADFAFSEERLDTLRELRGLLDARGVRHRAFVNPLSRPILERLRGDPAWAELERFRRELRRIFPDLVDLSESRYSAVENFFRFDPLHYLPDAGVRFMNEAVLRDWCGGGRDGGRDGPAIGVTSPADGVAG